MILYGLEHQVRAQNLGAALGEVVAGAAPLAAGAAIPHSTDTTLTIWGHGGPQQFAEFTPAQLAAFVQRWKTANPGLKTLELITCDARHVQDDRDSYTDKLMPLLIRGANVLVTVKGLPRGGSKATVSELWAGNAVGSDGYFFLAAEDDAALQVAVGQMQAALAAVPASVPVGGIFAAAAPLMTAAVTKLAMKGPVKFVSSGGSFAKLRSLLVPVTAYDDNGTMKSVPKTVV